MKTPMFYLLLGGAVITATSQAARDPTRSTRIGRPYIFELWKPAVVSSNLRQHHRTNYKLCVSDDASLQLCLKLLDDSRRASLDLPLGCTQRRSRTDCIFSVASHETDWMVVTTDLYAAARRAGLVPVLFERSDEKSLYIAAAPRSIRRQDLATIPIELDPLDARAFHAATYFNLLRGHYICPQLTYSHNSNTVKIVNSVRYVTSPQEVLVCPDHSFASFGFYRRCNFEAELQRAVFVSARRSSASWVAKMHQLVSAIVEHLDFGEDDLIFRSDTVSFDSQPSYRNGVNETVFAQLHCYPDRHISQLEWI